MLVAVTASRASLRTHRARSRPGRRVRSFVIGGRKVDSEGPEAKVEWPWQDGERN